MNGKNYTGGLSTSLFALLLSGLMFVGSVQAQPPKPVAGPVPAGPASGNVQLNLPNEVELKTLIDYVSQRLGIRILYDEQIANKKISLRAPGEVPAESLLGVLQSALKMKNLALVDAEVEGWKRITQVTQLPLIAVPGEAQAAIDRFGGSSAVTQAFVLKHADATKTDTVIKPFLTQQGSNSIAMKESNVLIVTDYAANILKISKLVEMIDRPRPDVVVEFFPLHNSEATGLAQQLSALVKAKGKAQGLQTGAEGGAEVVHDARTNQLMIVGRRDEVDDVLKIARSLDVPLGLRTEVYQLRGVAAERIDRLIQELISPVDAKLNYRSTVDADGNLLIATTTSEIHQRIRDLIAKMDVPAAQSMSQAQSRVRFYKLRNVTVAEMVETLRGIEQGKMPQSQNQGGQGRGQRGVRLNPGVQLPGQNQPPGPAGPMQAPPQTPAFRDPRDQQGPQVAQQQQGPATEERRSLLSPGAARLSGDPNTNTLIVIADPAVQQVYAELIRVLDNRRTQVLIEAKIVTLDTSDDFSLGVELSGGDRKGGKRLFSFSSFGLSKVDPVSGALAILPGLGFNGTLVDPDTADAVLRALTTHRRAKLMSSPRILVNDNATGVLASVAEVPFTSVNASQTVATTSFAGFAQAGTTITVTPHISERDHLQLEFSIEMNSFTGPGTAGIPPPRQTDEIESEVTIPDGHTIIVGGLNRMSDTFRVDSYPFLEDIPVLHWFASNRTTNSNRNSLFIFLRPIILRDDKFEDLKFVSERDVRKAGITGRFPTSCPLLVR